MDPVGKEVAIDIGGGYGEYFVERAKKEPGKQFIILEPRRLRIARKPRNLHIVQWRSDENSSLPFNSSSIDEANINFLYGEMRDVAGDSDEMSDEAVQFASERYEKILNDLKLVLKSGGLLRVVDAKGYTDRILSILKKLGYSLKQEPASLQDRDMTNWVRQFIEVSGEFAQPMLIEAFLR